MLNSRTLLLCAFAALLECVACSAPAPGKGFYLNAIVLDAAINNTLLRDNNTYTLGLTQPPYADTDHPSPISISTQNASELIVSPTNPHPGPISGRLALVQNGPNDWVLVKAFPPVEGRPYWNVGEDSETAVVKTSDWGFGEKNGKTVLTWNGASFWYTLRGRHSSGDGKGYDRWMIFWAKGSILAGAVPVTLEVVPMS
ncbi:hypothetical protein EJ04DRAFT_571000 [Polyplosphaeria fusca]|uniref:Uncharacterized protein n=1 Tax=Polyplosphaeria fusca TaxID=682080 RepID=A0A9P4QJ83_9PLEO|nr:hypothetical protein EJ04DRAFT_571000 [Polyplosphaeria fusca]